MKKKILIVTENTLVGKGGIQKTISNITQSLCAEYIFDVVVFSDISETNRDSFPVFRNIFYIPCEISKKRIQRLFENIFRPFKIYFKMRKIMRMNHYDVIHCNDFKKGGIALLAAKKSGISIRVCHRHNPEETDPVSWLKKIYYHTVKELVNPNSNVKIGCSKSACDYMYGDKSTDSFVVNNELDLKIFNPTKYFAKENDGKIHFIHIGRYTFQKNHEFLINVFFEIHMKKSNSILTLIGWGELENTIQEQIRRLGLEESILRLPADSDVPRILNDSDFMIFPSRYEGLGRVLVEAQAMNVMCFTSDVIPRETELGLCDYLPLSNGPSFWAKKIISFIDSNERSLRQINKDKLAQFEINNVMEKYRVIYNGGYCSQENK